MPAEMGTTAAWAKVRFTGFGASLSSRATAYSAKEPAAMPYTSSPTTKPVTDAPTSATVPATSRPETGFFGLRSPMASRTA